MPVTSRLPLVAALALLAFGCQPSQPETAQTPPATSACPLDPFGCFFMPLAGSAGLMEVELGKIAARRGQRPEVKAYATRMIREHTAINDEYRSLMRRKGMTPPSDMLPDMRLKVDTLQRLPAAEVDARYAQMMVSDHAMAVQLFQQAADSAHDAEYKEWLGRMVVVVQEHYQHARALQKGASQAHGSAGSH